MSKFFNGFGFALKGLRYAFETQLNFKYQCGMAILVVVLGFIFGVDKVEWLWLILAIGVVLVAELINTAIEVLVDLVSPSYHTLAGIVKDLAAGAVLLAALFALGVGAIIFLPKFAQYVA